MNFIFLITTFFLHTHAVEFKVTGQKGEVLLQTQKDVDMQKSLGALTITFLEEASLSYQGGEWGIQRIGNYGNDMQILSSSEMKAYGWCYTVNGFEPSLMADQFFLQNQNDKIHWFYGYAHYKDGQWISYCSTDTVLP